MCAQFTLIKTLKDLAKCLDFVIQDEILFPHRLVPSSKAPVVTNPPKGRALQAMRFGLIPSWSKEPKVKFATNNARLIWSYPHHCATAK
ncbi:MAG: SOS response-associated peptidase family protein [Elusimicrobia bacterium]|jgi:putative SOS response-associated peptidase YedK|nr:SOS response-associated peptidase family protein [Elusimicrobiota bacterium]